MHPSFDALQDQWWEWKIRIKGFCQQNICAISRIPNAESANEFLWGMGDVGPKLWHYQNKDWPFPSSGWLVDFPTTRSWCNTQDMLCCGVVCAWSNPENWNVRASAAAALWKLQSKTITGRKSLLSLQQPWQRVREFGLIATLWGLAGSPLWGKADLWDNSVLWKSFGYLSNDLKNPIERIRPFNNFMGGGKRGTFHISIFKISSFWWRWLQWRGSRNI